MNYECIRKTFVAGLWTRSRRSRGVMIPGHRDATHIESGRRSKPCQVRSESGDIDLK
jgi:hypothetical protein